MINIREIIAAGFVAAALGNAAAAATPAESGNPVLQNGATPLAPAFALGLAPSDGKKSLSTSLTQENEGYPNPDGNGRCTLVRRPVLDIRGNFLGYHTFNTCS